MNTTASYKSTVETQKALESSNQVMVSQITFQIQNLFSYKNQIFKIDSMAFGLRDV